MTEEKKRYGADAIVDSLANHDVKYVFGVPGAKIDRLFERLDHPVNPKAPKLIVTRHEQNASFIHNWRFIPHFDKWGMNRLLKAR